MSLYRPLNRCPRSDVHHVAESAVGLHGHAHQGIRQATEQDWTGSRKARPAEFIFPRTNRWIANLPLEFQPTATAEAFPRIANALAALAATPDALTSYLTELLVDKRGGRKGFPARVLVELHALTTYYTMVQPNPSSTTNKPE